MSLDLSIHQISVIETMKQSVSAMFLYVRPSCEKHRKRINGNKNGVKTTHNYFKMLQYDHEIPFICYKELIALFLVGKILSSQKTIIIRA